MTEHLLTGATPEPLSAYLIGLGVLRLLGEQGHDDATARWDDRGMVLDVALDVDDLLGFFLDDYVPTPMVSPWNKGAGYRGTGKSRSAEELVARALAGTNARLTDLRAAMQVARELNVAYPDDKAFERAKDDLIAAARSRMPDAALPWLDAAVTLTADRPVYPHILGTGGNLGRLDLSSNVLGHLERIIGFDDGQAEDETAAWLSDALFATGSRRLRNAAVGQYDPGVAGGVNSSSAGKGDKLANPWSFVLALEGAVAFASGLARRLGNHGDSFAAMPFTFRPDPVGAVHLSEQENPKGELWLPLWDAPATHDQVRALFAEGRIRWQGRTATRALDATRAVATLGAQRGVDAFARVAVIERLGQSPLAVPVGRIATGNRRAPALTGSLDSWLSRAKRINRAPRSLQPVLRDIDRALFEVSTTGDRQAAGGLSRMLVASWELEQILGRSGDLRSVGPAPVLDRAAWLTAIDDGSAEFRLATALTSARDVEPRVPRDQNRRSRGSWRPTMVEYLRPVAVINGWTSWDDGPSVTLDLRNDVVDSLARIHASHAQHPARFDDLAGSWPGFDDMTWTRRDDVEAFIANELDHQLLTAHLLATSLLVGRPPAARSTDHSPAPPAPASPTWRLLVPVLRRPGPDRDDGLGSAGPQPRAAWIGALLHGQVRQVLQTAIAQLSRLPGRRPPGQQATAAAMGANGPTLAAALLFHLSPSAHDHVLDWACPPDDDQMPPRGTSP